MIILEYKKSFHDLIIGVQLIPMEPPVKKKPGRPVKPQDQRRSARLQMRTFPEIAEKVSRVGTEAVEEAIRKIKEAK
jgi:hypothetical protein